MDFIAIDLETSNSKRASICQIGLAIFEKGTLKEQWTTLINPEDFFDPINVSIHGIKEKDVKTAPTFLEVHPVLEKKTRNSLMVCHTTFDMVALEQATKLYSLPSFERRWLDTARVVRRTWTEFSESGYGLSNLAKEFGIEFAHHNAGEDARVCGEILLRAINESGIELEEWVKKARKPISSSAGYKIAMAGNEDGPLFGESVVFTGSLSISRREAAEIAANAGCNVSRGLSKKITLLVLRDEKLLNLPPERKSSKHRKAEEMISKGHQIRIIGETDFMALTKQY